jgi:hypothetical protein
MAALCLLPLSGTEIARSESSLNKRLFLHVDGFSYHFNNKRDQRLNEFNYGLGFSYFLGTLKSDFTLLNDFQVFAEADVYSDSFSDFGYLLGASFQRPLSTHLNWGLHMGVIHEDNLEEKTDFYLYPFVFPYLQTNFDGFNMRIIFIPPVHNKGIIAFQIILS